LNKKTIHKEDKKYTTID